MLFRPSQPLQVAKRRLKLTTKGASVGGGYYKGNRVGSMGWHTKHGNYIIDLRKVRTYVPPLEITDNLLPFVPKDIIRPRNPFNAPRLKGPLSPEDEFRRQSGHSSAASFIGQLDGKRYLDLWKDRAAADPAKQPPTKYGYDAILPGQQITYDIRSKLNEASETKKDESAKKA